MNPGMLQELERNSSFSRLHSGGSLSGWLGRHPVLAALIVISLSLSVRLWLSSRINASSIGEEIPDAATYLCPAHNLVKHGAFLDCLLKPEVSRTPGYPAFLAFLMLLFGENLSLLLKIQASILSFQVLILYTWATGICSRAVAFLAALLAALSPWGAAFAGLPVTEGLYLLTLAFTLFLVKLCERRAGDWSGPWLCGCLGAVTGAAVLIRPLWFVVLLVGALLLFRVRSVRRTRALVLLLAFVTTAWSIPYLWKVRNQRVAAFEGISDIAGKTAWRYLASRVKADATGGDRFQLERASGVEEEGWNFSIQAADEERWRRAREVFSQFPWLTAYSFLRSAAEHAIHPSPDILLPYRLRFPGDYGVLAALWGGLLALAGVGLLMLLSGDASSAIGRSWLLGVTGMVLILTLASGLSFGAGSRLRTPLELSIPFLAVLGFTYLTQRLKLGRLAAWLT